MSHIRAGSGFLPSTIRVLGAAKRPLTSKEIVERAISMGLLKSKGRTPEKTLQAILLRYMRKEGSAAQVQHVEGGYQLRK